MYESFYGFSERPFQTNPNPALYFASRQHKRAMGFLEYGLHRNEGFIVVTGEVGAGKTTVIRSLISKLDSSKFIVANLVSTQLDAENALRLVASAFGVTTPNNSKADVLIGLQAFLLNAFKSGKRCLLVIDEAQNLSMQAVEELRMLSNFQQDTHALLQSFLVGQPEFRLTLQSPSMTQLRQRVTASCHIGPLDSADTEAYIRHRLTCCGWQNSPDFSDAFLAIYDATQGIPRRVNALCDRLLLSGFLAGTKFITREDVQEVFKEMDGETNIAPQSVSPSPPQESPAANSLTSNASGQQSIDALAYEDINLKIQRIHDRIQGMDNAMDSLLQVNTKILEVMRTLSERLERDGHPEKTGD